MNHTELSHKIKLKASSMGFAQCGISKASFLETEARDLEKWLKQNRHGKMAYMENYFDKRTDPRLLLDGAKSVISFIYNYFPEPSNTQPKGSPKISTYTWGEDYHTVLKRKLYALTEWLKEEVGEINFRVFTDSAPVMDKVWAKRSGLGWIGKHTNLIHPKMGSWFFIGEIIIDLDLEEDGPIKDYCGTCTACLDACPTDALKPYEIDANKCISYLTIELKEEMGTEFEGKLEGWAYGCDICQQVCPWNSFSNPESGDFKPMEHLLSYERKDWESVSKGEFRKLTKHSAMSRIKYDKWKHNLKMSKIPDSEE